MNHLLQKLRHIFHRKPRQRDLSGSPLLETYEEVERQTAESQNTEPYFCVTMLLRMMDEKREQEIAARKAEKADE